ncbi:MAG: serine/threonine-protein kinase [Thermoanaerobaculales bacterium]|nr:serine/threonine-protein kinase [Thermoanaerobaculales bacterium]
MNLVGSVIRNIRILERLGEGGMGQVYVGMDEKLKRRVAVKVIRPDRRLDARAKRRFLREARTLGQVEHINICRIYDFIEVGEEMVIVLELVQGVNVREALKKGLSYKQKLDIALQISQGLVAAHSMSVAHRDLKPENIMLTPDGVVKILDFGLARPLMGPSADIGDGLTSEPLPGEGSEGIRDEDDPLGTRGRSEKDPAAGQEALVDGTMTTVTQFGEIMGTPKYMSPEQARGEVVTAASDMYSFGLLIQELFCEECPVGEDLAISVVCKKAMWGESAPVEGLGTHLTALINRLKEFKPGMRPSVVAAAQRLQWIADLPGRRRRRALVAAVWALLLLFGAGMTVQSIRARHEAARAEEEALSARQVSDFLVELFEVSDPGEARGNSVTAREILDQGAQKIDRDLKDQPVVRARLMHVMGEVYRELGLYDRAEDLLGGALEVREHSLAPNHPDIGESLAALAALHRRQGRYPEAEQIYLRTLEMAEKQEDLDAQATLLTSLGGLYHSMGRPDEGLVLLERSLAMTEERHGSQDSRLSDTLHNIGMLLRDQGQCDEALPPLRRALEIDEKVFGNDHHLVASSLESLASVLWCVQRVDEAKPLLTRAVAIYELSLGLDHPHLANCLNTLGSVYWAEGDAPMSEVIMRRALGVYERALGENHPYVGDVLSNIAVMVSDQGRPEEALSLHRRSIDVCENAVGPDHPKVATSLLNLAVELAELGRFTEAKPHFGRALEIRRKVFGADSTIVGETVERYAEALRVAGKEAEADRLIQKSGVRGSE